MKKIFFIFSLFFIFLCKSPPPKVKIKTEPPTSEIRAGEEIYFIAKLGLTKSVPRFYWNSTGDCDAIFESPDRTRTKYIIPKDCKGGMNTISVEVTTERGISRAEKRIKILPSTKIEKLIVVRPEKIPSNWKILNDYENFSQPHKNLWNGAYGTWGFRGGKCEIISPSKNETGNLKIIYKLPLLTSSCGHFEYFKGELGKSEPVDLSSFEKFTFILKSGDGKTHKIRFELVEYDPWEEYVHQGLVGTSKIFLAVEEEKRYEIEMKEIIPPRMDIKSGKQIGIRIDRKDGNSPEGIVILDNLAFIEKDKN